jgi:hypothetical protein
MATKALDPAVSESIVAPFGIEIDQKRNSDVLLQSIPGMRLRSAIEASRPIIGKDGEPMVPVDQSMGLRAFPTTPGMQIHVNPQTCTYKVVDPLRGNEALCERIRRFLDQHSPMAADRKVDGVPTQEGKLDKHRMKTLCREMLWLLESGDAKVCMGAKPGMMDVNDLPGHYLLNPGSRVQNTQPMFEKDWDEWVDRLSMSGG